MDFRAFVDPQVDSGVPAGGDLIALGQAAALQVAADDVVAGIVDTIGERAAITAVEVAGAFGTVNRIMEATGSPVLAGQREQMRSVLEALGAMDFPHSGLTRDRGRSTWGKLVHRLKR